MAIAIWLLSGTVVLLLAALVWMWVTRNKATTGRVSTVVAALSAFAIGGAAGTQGGSGPTFMLSQIPNEKTITCSDADTLRLLDGQLLRPEHEFHLNGLRKNQVATMGLWFNDTLRLAWTYKKTQDQPDMMTRAIVTVVVDDTAKTLRIGD